MIEGVVKPEHVIMQGQQAATLQGSASSHFMTCTVEGPTRNSGCSNWMEAYLNITLA